MISNADSISVVTISRLPSGRSYQSRTLPDCFPGRGRFVSLSAWGIKFNNSFFETMITPSKGKLKLRGVLYTIFKQFQPASVTFATCVTRMLPGVDVIFRVRHQAQYIASRVANACNVQKRPIRVG